MLIAHHAELVSTNDAAAAWARRERGRWLAVTAETQRGGRGRDGRSWASPRGGLWMSLAAPLHTPLADRGPLPLVVGVAVRRVVARVCTRHGRRDAAVELKWPNDVLLEGGKTAGVLCEQALVPGQPQPPAILGIGLNANLPAEALGDGLRVPPATLRDTLGRGVDLPALAADLADAVRDAVEAWDAEGLSPALLDEIHTHLAGRGETVTIRPIRDTAACVTGRLEGVDAAGRLLILDDAGEAHAFDTGEIAPLTPAAVPLPACP